MSKRDDSSLILQNLKKRELPALGRPVVSLDLAEAQLTGARAAPAPESAATGMAIEQASESASLLASTIASSTDRGRRMTPSDSPRLGPKTRLQPRRRSARSALLVRLDPDLHRRLDEVARYNGLTMNDIVVEAIEMHLDDFTQPPDPER